MNIYICKYITFPNFHPIIKTYNSCNTINVASDALTFLFIIYIIDLVNLKYTSSTLRYLLKNWLGEMPTTFIFISNLFKFSWSSSSRGIAASLAALCSRKWILFCLFFGVWGGNIYLTLHIFEQKKNLLPIFCHICCLEVPLVFSIQKSLPLCFTCSIRTIYLALPIQGKATHLFSNLQFLNWAHQKTQY